jgi:HNH endonuclease
MLSKPLPPRDLVQQLLRYDPDTGHLWWLPRPQEMFVSKRGYAVWNANNAGKIAGGVHVANQRRTIVLNYKLYFSYRLVWLLVRGEPVPPRIDHIDGNALNDRIENLRAATQSQNLANARLRKTNKFGFKGIEMVGPKFGACIQFEGRKRWLGTFATVEEAAAARHEAASRLHREFARD